MINLHPSVIKHGARVAGLVLFGVAVGISAGHLPVHSVATLASSPAGSNAAIAYPLTIAAQRERAYTGSDFMVEASYGQAEGYSLKRVSYNSDGLRVQALMALPDTRRPILGFPVVILAHGYVPAGAYHTDGPEYKAEIRAFARAGYVVIKPDFRGYGGSWGTPTSAYYDTGDTADILNLAAALASYHTVDASVIGLWGHSMGGHVVFKALAAAPTRFKAAVIASGGIGTEADMYTSWRPHSDSDNPTAAGARDRLTQLFGTPRANPAFWNAISPLSYAADFTTPLQLHSGTSDTVVPSRFTNEAVAALTAAGHEPEVYSYPGLGHVYSGSTEQLLIARSLALYARTLHR